jgi:predicted transcriptional regulator
MAGYPSEARTISKRRKMCGLTQFNLAQASGISIQKIVNFETGRIALDADELGRIRKCLRQRAQKVFDAVANG